MRDYSIYIVQNLRKPWEMIFSEDIEKYLISRGHRAKIKPKEKFHLSGISLTKKDTLRSILVQDDETEEFINIEHHDKGSLYSTLLTGDSRCLITLKCQFCPLACTSDKISPFTYKVKNEWEYNKLRSRMLDLPNTDLKLFFKGSETPRRSILLNKLTDILNEDFGYRIQMSGPQSKRISFNEYMERMAASTIALSLPGSGVFCHREIEAFGIKTPVIMPVLSNEYFNPLIPDKHYIAILHLNSNNIMNYHQSDHYAKAIRNRYYEVINNSELLKNIANEAYCWYENNITYPGNMQLMSHILQKKIQYDI